ncbi:gamma-glutamylcyclotransferase family protein [Litoreibacter arenae]|uniref:Gamma-glutamylcyclotransferase AIG2-like domain-containing protein n=1 Tax=Litoreibacter arenae DSM 19593 TaxID=1123360 RepID=S9QQ02_9RHOB|nr:gamma-glutamylcyclotransferase family protein [Litoreibacter arenae]EPX81732.1 hypothetical protein thalar_00289 [Litoreibacter arenae DSM 19593]
MKKQYFFGYGSLVNTTTHTYGSTHVATLEGWRRVWTHTALRDIAYLSVAPASGSRIDGLIAGVPDSDWAALDIRETGYSRSLLQSTALTHAAGEVDVQMYQTHIERDAPSPVAQPILLSYLDVVVQGFHTQFGKDGVERFFQTTDGWEAPILNDRLQPRYPRSRTLSDRETALVDAHLENLKTSIIEPEQD